MADDGPPLLRPVPRRPFHVDLTSATPPKDEGSDNAIQDDDASSLNPDLSSSRFLGVGTPSDVAAISRPASFMNLTSSTLYGIYSPTTSRDRVFGDTGTDNTPWGTGSQTPTRRPSVDDATYELMRDRSHLHRRRSSYRTIDTTVRHSKSGPTAAAAVLPLVVRGSLLFGLGAGYGFLLARFQDSNQWPRAPSFSGDIIKSGQDWGHLAFWGVSAVVLGGALPWLDKIWEDMFGSDESDEAIDTDIGATEGSRLPTDWTLVMRAIGAFVGIVFAIRKLAWASTLQVSVTLALVNPLLWWIIDRSKVGFILSAAAGLVGSIFLMGINPGMMPSPPSNLALLRSSGSASGNESVDDATAAALFPLAGIASQETVETGVWMLSVLFCSCLCFGNIGRRLAWDKSAVGRGRWGGVR